MMIMLLKKMRYISNFVFGIFLVCFCCLKINNSYVYAETEKVVKISFIGDFGSGKTAFRDTICGLNFNFARRQATMETIVRDKTIIYDDNTVLRCLLYDTAGNSKFKEQVLDKHIQGSNFIVVAIDAARSTEECELFMERQMIGWMQEIKVRYPNTHVIWLFTKMDLLRSNRRQELEQNLDKWVSLYRGKVSTLFVSAKAGENMDQFFEIIKRVIREKNLLFSLPNYDHKIIEEKKYDTGCSIL